MLLKITKKDVKLDNDMSELLNALIDKKGFLKSMNSKPLTIVPAIGTAGAIGASQQKYQQGGGSISNHLNDLKKDAKKQAETNYINSEKKKENIISSLPNQQKKIHAIQKNVQHMYLMSQD